MTEKYYRQYTRSDEDKELGSQDIFEYIDFRNVLSDFFEGIVRFWLPILLSTSLAATVGFLYEKRMYKPLYLCSATFFVDVNNAVIYEDSTVSEKVMAQIANTFPYIINNDALKIIILDEFGVDEMPGELVVRAMSETNLITIQAYANSPEVSYRLLHTVLDNYPRISNKILGNTSMKMIGESGTRDEPINSDEAKKMALFCISVCSAGWVCLIFLYSILKTSIRKEEDFQNVLNINCFGSVPLVKFKKRSNSKNNILLVDQRSVGYSFTESIRILRTRIDRDQNEYQSKVYMISSSWPGEGKSTIASNLAFSFAEVGKKVILIDLDFRNPSICKVLGVEEKQDGFVNVILDNVDMEKICIEYEKNTNLLIMPPGKNTGNIGKLFNNPNVDKVIKQLRSKADIILIDTAPNGILSDTTSIAEYADAGIYVVRQDFAPVERIREGIDMLAETDLRIGGCILNMTEEGIAKYGYGYDYDSESRRYSR